MNFGLNNIPHKLIAFKVLIDGFDFAGIADVKLPDLELMSETIKGAGILGEIDSPTPGHFKSINCEIKWRTVEKAALTLFTPGNHVIDFRGSIQTTDSLTGLSGSDSLKVSVQAMMKKMSLGKMEVSSLMDTSTELEITRLTITHNNLPVLVIDKLNSIFAVNGVDQLLKVKADLGI